MSTGGQTRLNYCKFKLTYVHHSLVLKCDESKKTPEVVLDDWGIFLLSYNCLMLILALGVIFLLYSNPMFSKRTSRSVNQCERISHNHFLPHFHIFHTNLQLATFPLNLSLTHSSHHKNISITDLVAPLLIFTVDHSHPLITYQLCLFPFVTMFLLQ